MKRTKAKLVSSIVTLLICFAMLIGSTFAWFTDSASTGVNKIQAGNLDVEVEYSKDGTNWASIERTDSLFSRNLWEPGHTEYAYLKVKNAGSLALKYKVLVTPVSENGGINVYNRNFKLSDYLKFGTTAPSTNNTTYTDRAAARGAIGDGVAINGDGLTKESVIKANEADQYFALVVYMPDTVDNNANAKPGTTAPSIDLGIKVVATQLENESDSFNNNYDAGAENGSEYIAGPFYDYFQQVNLSQTVSTTGTFTLSTNNEETVSPTNTVIVTGQAADGSTVKVSVNKTSTPTGVTVEENRSSIAYNVNVTGQAAGSIVTVQLYVGTGLNNIKFYHTKSTGTVPMTKVDTFAGTDEDVDKFTYNKDTGVLTFKAKEFSPFTGVFDDAVAAITNENGTAVYGTLDAAINAAGNGDTITLLKDSVGNGIESKDRAKDRESLTIDFNGYTYTMNGRAVGSTGTESQAMHWGTSLGAVTLKNGTFKVAKGTTSVKMAMQNYIDFTAENMTFDFTTIPVDHYGNNFTGSNAVYNGLEIPLFNNGKSGTMVLRNCTISMPESSVKGINNDGHEIMIDSCTINGAVVMESANKVVKVKNSVITKDVSPYFNSGYTVKTSEADDGYTVYTNQTVVNASNTEGLTDAIKKNSEVTVKLTEAGTYNLPEMSNKEVSIIGTKDTVIDMKNKVNKAKSISFEGVTVNFGDENYRGFQHTGKLTYRDCTITGVQFLYADEVEFNNCVFEQEDIDHYNVWTYGAGNVLFKDCTFNCAGKSVLIYKEKSNIGQTVEFKNCKFSATTPVDGKAAIEIDSSLLYDNGMYKVIIDQATANSVSGFGKGSVSKNSVWNNKKGNKATVIVAGSTVLSAN